MAKAKATGSLFDLVMSKSKAFIDKAKKPLLERKAKREFKSMIEQSISEIVDLKEETLELLTDVRDLNVQQLVANMQEMEDIKAEMLHVVEIYKLIFGEVLELDLEEIDLGIDVDAVLERVSEVEKEKAE